MDNRKRVGDRTQPYMTPLLMGLLKELDRPPQRRQNIQGPYFETSPQPNTYI